MAHRKTRTNRPSRRNPLAEALKALHTAFRASTHRQRREFTRALSTLR